MLTVLAHLESAAAGPHRLPHARRTHRLGGMPCPEEVEPQLPMGSNPQIPLADSDEDSHLHDRIGVEVVELHTIVVRERSHESVRRNAEAALVEGDEAHDVTVVGPRLQLAERSNPLRPARVCHRAEESTVDKRLEHFLGDVRWIPRVRLDNDDVAGHGCDGGIGHGGEFFFSPPPTLSLFFLAFPLGSLFSPLLPGTRCSGDGSTEVVGKVR